MEIQFSKYQATGNDFIVIDGDANEYPRRAEDLERLCHRRYGVGADGVIVVKKHPDFDFEVIYFNPDGSLSFCGNGTRSAIHFARSMGLFHSPHAHFLASDGEHRSEILPSGLIRLQMNDVQNVRFLEDGIFIDTGSPHLVLFVKEVEKVDVVGIGRRLRYEAPIEFGTNVNFVEIEGDARLKIRTYERGVEDETYSCGTGVTASALAASLNEMQGPIHINTKGGELDVEFKRNEKGGFSDVYLTGPAECVYQGSLKW